MIEQLRQPGAWIEIAVLAVTFYVMLNFLRGTRGAEIVKGIAFLFAAAFLGVMYLADLLNLQHIQEALRWILSGAALVSVIIFAPEIRRGLSHLAQSPLLSLVLRARRGRVTDILASTIDRFSIGRIGAIIVIERSVGLGEYVENGVRLDAVLSGELLETLFHPKTVLHDGAVILQGDRVAAAGCLLPLTDDPTLSKSMGTRHRAAIGISEETDAVAIVVSEGTGRVSAAVKGKLTEDLTHETLEKLLREVQAPEEEAKS